MLNIAVNATEATIATNLTSKVAANTRAAAETTEIQVIITTTLVMLHSPQIITVTIKKDTAVNRVIITTAVAATGAMAAIAIILITKGAAMDMTEIVLMAAIIAGITNTEVTADFGYGS